MFVRSSAILLTVTIVAVASGVHADPTAAAIDSYLQPYIESRNFSGAVLVKKDAKVIFEKAYGFADRENRKRNTTETQFHIASMSMQFTAATVLRLVDAGSMSLDDTVAHFVGGIGGAKKITIRDLLTQRSGLPDINTLPGYDEILQHHQTPESLIEKIKGRPLLFEPGSKYLHEEHSAYNLLALIIEKKTGVSFAPAVKRLLFQPIGLAASGVDDDSINASARMAKGYEPAGTAGLKPAQSIHWSAKTGNASVYTTTGDVARWVDVLFKGGTLSAASRSAVLDTSIKVGYGWFRGENKRFGHTAYNMNGRAPGFASFVLYLPDPQLTVVVLSNIYSSVTTSIGYDIAALTLGLKYEPLNFLGRPLTSKELNGCTGTFQFGPDFYAANAKIALIANGQELSIRWPDGDLSPLIPLDRNHFVDRSYWEEVKIEQDRSGRPSAVVYDRYRGKATPH
jgi:CubicO group peptidase (beta-lactamase class C family)